MNVSTLKDYHNNDVLDFSPCQPTFALATAAPQQTWARGLDVPVMDRAKGGGCLSGGAAPRKPCASARVGWPGWDDVRLILRPLADPRDAALPSACW